MHIKLIIVPRLVAKVIFPMAHGCVFGPLKQFFIHIRCQNAPPGAQNRLEVRVGGLQPVLGHHDKRLKWLNVKGFWDEFQELKRPSKASKHTKTIVPGIPRWTCVTFAPKKNSHSGPLF